MPTTARMLAHTQELVLDAECMIANLAFASRGAEMLVWCDRHDRLRAIEDYLEVRLARGIAGELVD